MKEDPWPPQSLFPQRQENALTSFDDGPHIGVTLHQRGVGGKYSRHLTGAPRLASAQSNRAGYTHRLTATCATLLRSRFELTISPIMASSPG